MSSRLLITGHTGFIGTALTRRLQASGKVEITGVSLSTGDDLRIKGVAEAKGEFDRVIHLAGVVGVPGSWRDPQAYFESNINTTLNTLEIARTHKTPFVLLSSYLYGTPQYLPIDERHPVRCTNPYARSKQMAETLCEAYAQDFGVPVTILRPFNVYGSGQEADNVISQIVSQAKVGNKILVKDVRPKRDFLHVDDLVSAILQCIEGQPESFSIYNLGSGRSHSVLDVIELVSRALNRQFEVKSSEEPRPNEILDCYANCEKFRSRFHWEPRIDFAEGLGTLLRNPPLC